MCVWGGEREREEPVNVKPDNSIWKLLFAANTKALYRQTHSKNGGKVTGVAAQEMPLHGYFFPLWKAIVVVVVGRWFFLRP